MSAAGHCLQETGLLGIVVECDANLPDSSVNPLLDVDEYIFAPECIGDLLARYQLAGFSIRYINN